MASALSTKDKIAILLISLGKEYASKIYKHLSDDEIEQITLSITSMRRVSPEQQEEVLSEFCDICMAQKYISEGGIEYARDVLNKALGQNKADEMIQRLSSTLRVRPFDFIRRTDSAQVLNFIQNEHPQTIALVLSYLTPQQAAMVLSSLPLEKQTNVIARIAKMGSSAPEYVKEAERVLERKLSMLISGNQTQVGGVDILVDILNSVDRSTEKNLLESLGERDEELAEEIRNRMFVFEDITKLSDQAIQRVLKDVDNRDLAVALKGANSEVVRTVFKNISKRMQEMVREDMEMMGPVRVSAVEEAQQRIVNVIRKLDDAGEIYVSRSQEDEVIV